MRMMNSPYSTSVEAEKENPKSDSLRWPKDEKSKGTEGLIQGLHPVRHRRYELTWPHLSRGKGEGTELRLYKIRGPKVHGWEEEEVVQGQHPGRQRRYGKVGSDNATAHPAYTDDTSSRKNRMVIETSYRESATLNPSKAAGVSHHLWILRTPFQQGV